MLIFKRHCSYIQGKQNKLHCRCCEWKTTCVREFLLQTKLKQSYGKKKTLLRKKKINDKINKEATRNNNKQMTVLAFFMSTFSCSSEQSL